MKYSAKVPLDLSGIGFCSLATPLEHFAKLTADTSPLVNLYALSPEQQNYITNQLPATLRKRDNTYVWTRIDVPSTVSEIHAHKHEYGTCMLNYYLSTNGETTKFFEGTPIRDDSVAVDNNNVYYMANMIDLVEADSFTAQNNEAWAFSLVPCHGVYTSTAQQHPRDLIQIIFNGVSFEEVVAAFA